MSLSSNSSETPLSSADTFTGSWELVKSFVAVSRSEERRVLFRSYIIKFL